MTDPNAHAGDLRRSIVQDINDDWPDHLEIVAYWGKSRSHSRRKAIEISADKFFGRGGYGAPMTGDEVFRLINKLRLMR